MCRWNMFENMSIFGEDMEKFAAYFFGHPVYVIVTVS